MVAAPRVVKSLKKLFPLSFPVLAAAVLYSIHRHWSPGTAALLAGSAMLAVYSFVARERGGIETLVTAVTGPATGETLFFIHGWPDNASIWESQVAHLSQKGYRCVTITLPNFGGRGRPDGAVPWGYDFDELAEMCGRTMKASLAQSKQQQGTLVLHDWGCHIGFLLERLHPELVRRVVAMDVGLPTFKGQSFAFLPIMVIAGLVYQWWLATAFLIATLVPLVGPLIGDLMTGFAISCIGDRFHQTTEYRQENVSAAMNYPYFWFHLSFWLEASGLRPSFDDRHGCADRHAGRDPVPILFFYGADKGFKFHGQKWEDKLRTQGVVNGSKVVPLPDPAESVAFAMGIHPRPKAVGHWVQLREPETVNTEMAAWLRKTDGDDVD